jgi:phospholipid/cholesterol/gamma-HCH transport system permease protein
MATTVLPGSRASEPEPPPAATRRPRLAGRLLSEAGDLTIFSLRVVAGLPVACRYLAEVLRHAAAMVRSTTVLMFVMNAFIGMSTVNFLYFFLHGIGAADITGVGTGYCSVRQCSPTMFGYVFTATICCGITATLGAMQINEEIDAYTSEAVDPIHYVVGTRILAVILFLPIAAFVSFLGYYLGAYATAVIVIQGIAGGTLSSVHFSIQTLTDYGFSLINMAGIAVVTATAAAFYGLRTRGGPASVGSSVARGVVVNLVLVHVISVFFAVLFYGSDVRLPVGG